MNTKNYLAAIFLFVSLSSFAQFHTLNIPQSSPQVTESQKIGVTNITISYNSPALRGRDVWNNSNIIPQKGNPIAWRAGANMNTTISFSTDISIEDLQLAAGTYGLHIIPENDTYTLLFAHNSEQWGSYYLDQDKDVSLKVKVNPSSCTSSEQLDFEFLERTEKSVVIGLEWGEKRIPFKVEVDLNKTVVESFRKELRGINTYHWQAWNDAANWCYAHDTNLEQALEWASRSIDGGYGSFAANKNITNLTTKINILAKLNRDEALSATVKEAKSISSSAYESNGFIMVLLHNNLYTDALEYTNNALEKHPDTWFLELNRGLCHYFLGDKKKALKEVRMAMSKSPEPYKKRLEGIIKDMDAGTYRLRRR